MYQTYQDRAAFLFVYIREAHPADEWQLPVNEESDVVFAQPTTFGERREVAETCSAELALTMPCVVDDMDNTVDNAYAAWPERLVVIDRDGNVGYCSKQGPWGFEPAEVEAWLRKNAGS